MTFSPGPASFIRGPKSALPSNPRGGGRVPEWGPLGSVRGALSNERPYRDLENVVAKYPFERPHKFPGIQPNSGHRDYSRLSCRAGEMQLGPSAQDLDRALGGRWSTAPCEDANKMVGRPKAAEVVRPTVQQQQPIQPKEVEEATPHRDIGDICAEDGVGQLVVKMEKRLWLVRVLGVGFARLGGEVDGREAGRVHNPKAGLAPTAPAVTSQMQCHLPRAVPRCLQE